MYLISIEMNLKNAHNNTVNIKQKEIANDFHDVEKIIKETKDTIKKNINKYGRSIGAIYALNVDEHDPFEKIEQTKGEILYSIMGNDSSDVKESYKEYYAMMQKQYNDMLMDLL